MAFRAELDDFATLYERTYPALYRTALGICGDAGLAADVTQDAYESAYRERAGFKGDAPVDAWLHRIAMNAALSGLRRRRVRWAEPLDLARHDRAAATPDTADALALRKALDGLDPRSRAAVVLRYYHDFDYVTIAAILRTSPGNVGAILTRARERLRSDLDPTSPRSITPTTQEVDHGR